MNHASILFQFTDRRSAFEAFDTLEELGYRPTYSADETKPQLHIHFNHSDVTSALEVAQAHGGTLVEQQEFPAMKLDNKDQRTLSEYQAFQMSYNLDNEHDNEHDHDQETSIPAHMVNEDWTEEYADVRNQYEG